MHYISLPIVMHWPHENKFPLCGTLRWFCSFVFHTKPIDQKLLILFFLRRCGHLATNRMVFRVCGWRWFVMPVLRFYTIRCFAFLIFGCTVFWVVVAVVWCFFFTVVRCDVRVYRNSWYDWYSILCVLMLFRFFNVVVVVVVAAIVTFFLYLSATHYSHTLHYTRSTFLFITIIILFAIFSRSLACLLQFFSIFYYYCLIRFFHRC